ncbi:MAG: TM0106 family RecB-like putative nuclease [Actinomycetota bacterium]|nr:TM0106 family RecB-like putative nuclease [Actinomycetota bacterium]
MEIRAGKFFVSPSDVDDFLACEHLARLEVAVASGEVERPERANPQGELIRRKGDAHERAYLESLIAGGKEIFAVTARGEHGARATEDAMRAGVDVIYQAALVDGSWRGYSDFLFRVASSSDLGAHSYEAADTKLARRPKPAHVLQLAFYSEQVARIQGVEPELMHLVLGSGQVESFRPPDFAAYYRRVRSRFLAFVASPPATYPYPVERCPLCTFLELCEARWEKDDHLVRVASIRRDQIERLEAAGITRLQQLARAAPRTPVPRLAYSTFEKLRDQAALQQRERETGELAYRLLEPEDGRGFSLLPKPSPGDVFFDMEGDPFWEPERGLEYLFGALSNGAGGIGYRAFWGHDRVGEKRAFEEVVDFLHERLAADPALHVYHYGSYEPAALKRLMGEHATREDEVDELLRREVFVDLFAVVRQGLRASRPSYSLKEIERFYLERRAAGVGGGGDATLAYEEWIETRNDALLSAIARYNEDDCRSTLLLREWLLERRAEAESEWGREVEWREPRAPRDPPPDAFEALEERARLRAELLRGAEEGDERWLAAQLLDYHRREAKPGWWDFFRRLKLTPAELLEDAESIGELEPAGEATPWRKSLLHAFTFPPQQHKLAAGADVVDPVTGESAGKILSLNDEEGRLELVRGPRLARVPLPRALIPTGPYRADEQRAALARLARAIVEGDERYAALRLVLRREPPRFLARERGGSIQTTDLGEMRRLVADLDRSYLFVQGPPGSGKTWTGARLVAHLLAQGARVGVASTSHKAIHNALDEIEKAGLSCRGLKKCTDGNPESEYESDHVESEAEISPFLDPDVRLVAGTAWLFAREEMDGTLDYLLIDEAGQVSLADALAMGTAARNLILLGDPLQLAQVVQGIHPGASGASVLAHLLGDSSTIPEGRGLFLERTFRMHPDVSRFVSNAFYEGRLESAEECGGQATAFGTGIRFLPVPHRANRQSSPEEAERIRVEIARMTGGGYTTARGDWLALREEDFVVVAPFNAHVRCLRAALPDGVRVGTVDKFQGQEAAVVFFSMASSSGEDIPRGMEFLFSRNRLNVAISRARCLAFLVASPRLLEIKCRTVEQMRLANALCLFVELVDGEERARA